MFFGSNVRLLRTRKNRTQDDVAYAVGMTRSTVNSYENGTIKNPTVEALLTFSNYFHIAIDTLLKTDLNKLRESQLTELERGNDVFIKGSRLRVLATTVDNKNNENIEVVSHKAKAGYRQGFADPEYIKRLPTFQLPILFNDRKYRMFQVSGDSMNPIPDKSWIIAEYLENWYNIKNGQAYVILTLEDGIVFKIAQNKLKKEGLLQLASLNTEYEPYEVHISDIKEVWRFCNYISDELPDNSVQRNNVLEKLKMLGTQIEQITDTLEVKD